MAYIYIYIYIVARWKMSESYASVPKHTQNPRKDLWNRTWKILLSLNFSSFSGQNTFYFIRIDSILLKIWAKMQKLKIYWKFNFLPDLLLWISCYCFCECAFPTFSHHLTSLQMFLSCWYTRTASTVVWSLPAPQMHLLPMCNSR